MGLSTCEAEYVATSVNCSQVLYVQQQMRDCGLEFLKTPIFVDNYVTIAITKGFDVEFIDDRIFIPEGIIFKSIYFPSWHR